MKRLFTILLFSLILLLSLNCGNKGPTGKWLPSSTGKENTFFHLNFLTPETGWVVGWDETGPKETQGWEIVQTHDGGKSWLALPNQIEQRIKLVHFVTEKVGWALNIDNDILYTADGGETWTPQRKAGRVSIKYKYNNPGAPTELSDPLTNIKFINEKVGWAWGGGKKDNAVEQEGIFLHTTDGGQQWQALPYPFLDELKTCFFLDSKTLWASDRKAGLYQSTDGGKTWQKQPDDIKRPSINGIFFINPLQGWIVGSDGYIGKTIDGGKNWRKNRIGKAYLNDLFFINENVGWVVGEASTILYTQDGGEHWQKEESGIQEGTITRLQFFNDKSGWAAGNNGLLLHYQGS